MRKVGFGRQWTGYLAGMQAQKLPRFGSSYRGKFIRPGDRLTLLSVLSVMSVSAGGLSCGDEGTPGAVVPPRGGGMGGNAGMSGGVGAGGAGGDGVVEGPIAIPGASGSAGSGGTGTSGSGGRGGSGVIGGFPGISGGGTAGSGPGNGGAGGSAPGASGGTGGRAAGGTPDANPGTPPVEAGRPGADPIEVEECAEVDCPSLFQEVVATCDQGTDEMCKENLTSEDPERLVQCFANGVKKVMTSSDDGNRETWAVTESGSAACYTIQIDFLNDDADTELWVIRSPTGQELGRAVDDAEATIFTCSANGKSYDISDAECPGFDLQAFCDEDASCN